MLEDDGLPRIEISLRRLPGNHRPHAASRYLRRAVRGIGRGPNQKTAGSQLLRGGPGRAASGRMAQAGVSVNDARRATHGATLVQLRAARRAVVHLRRPRLHRPTEDQAQGRAVGAELPPDATSRAYGGVGRDPAGGSGIVADGSLPPAPEAPPSMPAGPDPSGHIAVPRFDGS